MILALVCATVMPCAFAVPAWDKVSLEAAEKFLRVNADGVASDIHQAEQFPDGARGFYIETLPPLRAYTPKAGESAEDQMLGQTVCGAQLMVLAKAGDSVSALTRRNASILTRTEFEIVDVVRARAGLLVGPRVSVVRVGGEVVDQGVRLRVVEERGGALVSGQTYWLALVQPKGSASQDFFLSGDPVPVRAGRIEPWSGRWEKFRSGDAFAAVKEEVRRVSRRQQCGE